jgi:hypothetical protein
MQGNTTVVCNNVANAPDALSLSADDVQVAFDFTSLLADAVDGDLAPVIEVLSHLLTPEVLAQVLSGDFSQVGSAGLEVTDGVDLSGDAPIEVFLFGKSFFLSFDQQEV